MLGGNSQRFPSNKLFYDFEGYYLFEHGYRVLNELVKKRTDCKLIVVTQYPQIKQYIPSCIVDQQCSLGLSYTIQTALKSIDINDHDYMMFVVGDQPYMNIHSLELLIDEIFHHQALVGCLGYRGQLGNPAMFHGSLYQEFMALDHDQGGKVVYRRHLDQSFVVEVEDCRELYDIDTLDDVKAIM